MYEQTINASEKQFSYRRNTVCNLVYNHSKQYSHKKVKYDALWQINLIKGFLIVWPNVECGAMIYEMENSGKRMPAREWKTEFHKWDSQFRPSPVCLPAQRSIPQRAEAMIICIQLKVKITISLYYIMLYLPAMEGRAAKIHSSEWYLPIRTISSACRAIFFRRKPGSPSYQMLASSCCTLGWETNCNGWEKADDQKCSDKKRGYLMNRKYICFAKL